MMVEHHHNPALVFLSVLIAIFASYTALDLANSVSVSKGKGRWVWLVGGSLAMGIGIWSMHFIGMLAFSLPGIPIAYDVPLLILSILVAILASFLSLILVIRERASFAIRVAGSLTMGAAISGMHYIGIWSMRLPASIEWNLALVVASILIAIVASFVALILAFKLRYDITPKGFLFRGAGGAVMGVAIAGMHYTAMAAMHFTKTAGPPLLDEQLLATNGLAASVIVGTLIILGIALTGSNIERALARRTVINEALQEAIKSRDAFFSIASHELKTPLTSVKLQTQLILKYFLSGTMDKDKITKMLSQTDESVDRLTRLVDDMLDIARLQTGKLSLQREEFQLDVTIQEVIERLHPLLEAAHCPVFFEDKFSLVGHWDKFRIEQVITNILTNAARYGEGQPIVIKMHKEADFVQVSFKDYGKGIAEEDQERIFQRFERAAEAHQTRALGLGLFIVKEIMLMHGGDIKVESEPGKGSEFIVSLPLKEENERPS